MLKDVGCPFPPKLSGCFFVESYLKTDKMNREYFSTLILKIIGVLPKTFSILLICMALLAPSVCYAWLARVTDVPYGDHLQVMIGGKKEIIRLYGIDSPIEPQPFGREARLYTAKRTLGRVVEIEPITRDKLDRIIAWVYIDGECLNKELLRKGMTWWYKKYVPFELELAKIEEEARKARVGLWADPAPIPPWEYQPLPPSEGAGPKDQRTLGRRGAIREKIISNVGQSKKIFGDEGSVRQRLMDMRSSEQGESQPSK